ncbi:hypothetical protein BUMB_04308c [Candidatus Paraburkholderia calva]|nr:hypothetical protein BUMB_04308c [Candidatus Paraburkholderia calva]
MCSPAVFTGRLPSNDLMSFVLFFICLVLSAIAFWKGYACDDRHPGHGKRDRLSAEASKKFDSELDVVWLNVVGAIQRHITDMAAAKTQMLSTKARLDQIKNGIYVDIASLKAYLSQLQRDFALVLNVYR